MSLLAGHDQRSAPPGVARWRVKSSLTIIVRHAGYSGAPAAIQSKMV